MQTKARTNTLLCVTSFYCVLHLTLLHHFTVCVLHHLTVCYIIYHVLRVFHYLPCVTCYHVSYIILYYCVLHHLTMCW